MTLNSINIYTSAIEDTLESYPRVAEAVGYRIKSCIHDESPVAAAVLKEDARCTVLEMLDHIPRNAGGKVLRRALSAAH